MSRYLAFMSVCFVASTLITLIILDRSAAYFIMAISACLALASIAWSLANPVEGPNA